MLGSSGRRFLFGRWVVRIASRIYALVLLLALLSVGGGKAYFAWKDNYNRTLGGSIMVQDPAMVYDGGHPVEELSRGSAFGVDDGCHGAGFEIGTLVTLTELDGTRLASGRVVSTFHWNDLDDPTGYIASRAAHGCAFGYEITGVPKRESYAVVIGSTVYLPELWEADLHPTGDGEYHIIPTIEIGWGDGKS